MIASKEMEESIQALSKILNRQCRIIDALIAATIGHQSAKSIRGELIEVPDKVMVVLPLLLQAAGSSTNTLIRLSDASGLHTRDCYSIARSIVEIASNICFVIAEGPEAADRAMRHARQKSYRDLKRESAIGNSRINLNFSGIDEIRKDDIEDDLNEFTRKSNREKDWTDSTIDQRIEIAGSTLGGKILSYLHMARFIVYRHSSEILHGSFFGALFFFGETAPPKRHSLEDYRENFAEHHIMILQASILSLAAVVESFHLAYGFEWAFEHSTDLLKSMKEIPYFARINAGNS